MTEPSWEFYDTDKDNDSAGYFPEHGKGIKCHYGQVGDLIYCKESFDVMSWDKEWHTLQVRYSDHSFAYCELTEKEWQKFMKWKNQKGKKSSLFMFKSLPRIWLEITSIRVDRLQDITEQDAIAEGVEYYGEESNDYKNYAYDDKFGDDWGVLTAKQSYESLWNSINGARATWESNPFVFVISFKKINIKPLWQR